MSTAFYPQGMKSYNNTLPTGGYKTWKGEGVFSNPTNLSYGSVRPLTNGDITNAFPATFGKARPIKHHRKGRHMNVPLKYLTVDPNDPTKVIEVEYMLDRNVNSTRQGGSMIQVTMDNPARVITKPATTLDKACNTCFGTSSVSTWQPKTSLTEIPSETNTSKEHCSNEEKKARNRVRYATTNLNRNYYTTMHEYLFNRCQTYDQRAFNFTKGVTNQEQLEAIMDSQNITNTDLIESKPGDPLTVFNMYVANCNPHGEVTVGADIAVMNRIIDILVQKGYLTQADKNTYRGENIQDFKTFIAYIQSTVNPAQLEVVLAMIDEIVFHPFDFKYGHGPTNPKGCAAVYYKPNNPQYAKTGAVSSSSRLLKLNVDTITKSASKIKALKKSGLVNDISPNNLSTTAPFVLKTKVPPCDSNKSCAKTQLFKHYA